MEVTYMETLLKLQNIQKKFHKKDILKQVNMNVFAGEVLFLKGANGSGKTTLFRSIMNLVKVDAGEIYWLEKEINKLDTPHRVNLGISFMPQLSTLIDDLRVDETIRLTKELFKGRELEPPTALTSLTNKIFDTREHAQKKVLQLSRGESRKFEFVLSLMFNAHLYMYDESTSGWDAQSRQDAYLALSELKKMGKAVVLCDHTQMGFPKNFIDSEYEITEATLHKVKGNKK